MKKMVLIGSLILSQVAFASSEGKSYAEKMKDIKQNVTCALQVLNKQGEVSDVNLKWVDTGAFGSGYRAQATVDQQQVEALVILMPYEATGVSALANFELSVKDKDGQELASGNSNMAAVAQGPKTGLLGLNANGTSYKFGCFPK